MAIEPICPFCGRSTTWTTNPNAILVPGVNATTSEHPFLTYRANRCPACGEISVWLEEGRWVEGGSQQQLVPDLDSIVGRWVRPAVVTRTLDERIPADLRQEFIEAEGTLPISPNASAALSRRILQRLLREHTAAQPKSRKLVDEIDAFVEQERPPSYVADGLHRVRGIGNTAAHTDFDAAGVIFNVLPEEAEYTLGVVAGLFDHLIVAPADAEARVRHFDERRESAGLRPLPSPAQQRSRDDVR